MKGLTWDLKQKVKNGFVKLNELMPNTKSIAERMIKNGEIYICKKGYLRLNSLD